MERLHDEIILGTLADSWSVVRDFPQLQGTIIERPHLLDTIFQILSKDTPVVFLEGEEGCGSTTTLAQFCQAYPDRTFSLFIKPASRFAYNIDYLRLSLYEQFYWYLYSTALERDRIDESEYDSLLLKVRRNKKASTLYFVIDGLHQIPSEDRRIVEQIVRDVLPIGVDNFRFLISGSQAHFGKLFKHIGTKPYQQLKFSHIETEQYLCDLSLEKNELTDIGKLCNGIPGRLASVKRLLQSGKKLDAIIDSDPSKYPEFIRLEFEQLDFLSNKQQKIVAVLAFGKRALTEQDLVDIVGVTIEDLQIIKQKCLFLASNPQTHMLEFSSESHRRFAEKRLEHFQKDALALQVDYLLRNPHSPVALRFLPTYYQQLNQQQAIVDLLSTEHYKKLLEDTQSITALRNRAEIGAKSAELLRQTTEVFKFSLQRNIFLAVANRDALESEIGALVALGQSQRALTLASKAIAKEDRLALLAAYAKRFKEKNGTIDPELVNYIKEIAAQINFAEYGDKAMEIASDVLFVDPDLAISIVDQASKSPERAEDRDKALAHLSITASLSKLSNKTLVDDKARNKISDEALLKVTASFAALASDFSPTEIILAANQMEPRHRLYFLKKVIGLNQKQENILDVVEYALDVMIHDTAYTPKSRDLADLARPLPHATHEQARIKHVIKRFEGQLGLIQNRSVSKDLVILQMRLARAEISFDPCRATTRIEEVYYDVASLKDLEIQIECYALMLYSLDILDKDGDLEQEQGYRAIIKTELTNVLDTVLAQTANHFVVVRGALRALAPYDSTAALKLASRLNSEECRQDGYQEVARIIALRRFSNERADALTTAINLIKHPQKRAETICSLVDKLALNADKASWIEKLVEFEPLIELSELACEFVIGIFKIEVELGRNPCLERFHSQFKKLIDEIDSKLSRIDLTFKAVEVLAKLDREVATQYYDMGRQIRQEIKLNSNSAVDILEICLALLSRALSPIMKSGQINDELLTRFENLVELIPSSVTRGAIYAELAIRAWCAKKNDLCKDLIQKHCLPLLDLCSASSGNIYKELVVAMFPALYCVHQLSALQRLSTLYVDERDSVLFETAMILLRKLPASDPYYNNEFDRCKISHEDVLDILQILESIETDSTFYSVLESLVNALCGKENRANFTGQQKTDYANRLYKMIDNKLPDPLNISHPGFKLAALAQTYQLEHTPYDKWKMIIKDAESVDNIADRGLVLLTIAECIPAKHDDQKKKLYEEALRLFYLIPSTVDRLTRLERYSNAKLTSGSGNVKEVLKNALMLTLEIDEQHDPSKHQRRIIDLADKIDFADTLVELIDDDPARAMAKMQLKQSLDASKAKRAIANAKDAKEAGKLSTEYLTNAAWKNVAALVAGRLETKSPELMTEYVVAAGAFSLEEAFPVLAWHIENSARRFLSESNIAEQLLPMCEALLLSTEMAATVIAHSSKVNLDISASIDVDPIDGPMILPRNREQAIEYIRKWLHDNANEYIRYCDAYFGPRDLEFLRLVLSECPNCKVVILTSKKTLKKEKALSEEVFLEYWKELVDQDPPETEIVAVGSIGDEKILIHDRWLLTNGAGLRIGTSFNSLGEGKLSEISRMEPAKAIACEQHLNKFFNKDRIIDGVRVSYSSFTL